MYSIPILFQFIINREEYNIEDIKLYLQFQKAVTEFKLKTINQFLKGEKIKADRGTSKIKLVENVLRIAGRPLHISEIIEIAQRDFEAQLERDSIVSILTKKIKANQKFVRTAPNTFTLKQ